MALPDPFFPFAITHDYGLFASDPSLGPVLRGRNRGTAKVRSFGYDVRLATQAEKDGTFTEHSTAKGRAGSLSFTPPGESATTAQFTDDETTGEYRGGPAGHSLTLRLEEPL